MAGRGRTKSEEKRQQILAAATALFIDEGYAGVSMDDIARHAGVSKQTVYNHFSSKENLFQAAIQSKCIQYELTEAFFAQPRPIESTLLELARHLADLLLSEEPLALLRVITAEAETHPEVAELFFKTGPRELTRLLGNYLTDKDKERSLRVENPFYAAVQFVSMVKGEAHFAASLSLPSWEPDQLDAYLQDVVKHFVKAYQP